MGAPRRTFPGKKPGVWPYSRGLKGPLSAVWDSNLRSWCLKTIRQRPPSLALGHPTLAPDGLRLARPLPTRLVPWGEACAEWAHARVGQGTGWSWGGTCRMEDQDFAVRSPSWGCVVETGPGHGVSGGGGHGAVKRPRIQGSEMEGHSEPQAP